LYSKIFQLEHTKTLQSEFRPLLGWVQDLDTSARFLFLEASRRFGDNWLLTAELRTFLNQPPEDFLFEQHDDEVMQIELSYYF